MSYSSSTTACFKLTDSTNSKSWSGAASGSASGSTQQDADSSLNNVMKVLLLELLSKGLNASYSTSTPGTGCNWCGKTRFTQCGNCVTNRYGSTTTYYYVSTLTLSTNYCQSDLEYTPIAYVYLYCVMSAGCSADYVQESCQFVYCLETNYVPITTG
jgi:hypothetical protein